MTDLIESTLRRLGGQLPGRTSRPGEERYVAATAIWAKPIGLMPRMVVHCHRSQTFSWQSLQRGPPVLRCRCAAVDTTGPVAPCAADLCSISAA